MSTLKQLDMDLDNLLDEVESRYVHSPHMSPSPVLTAHSPRDQLDLEVDTLLEEINQIENLPISRPKHKTNCTFHQNREIKYKCEDLILTGSQIEMGKHSSNFPLACDRIRCTSCDFKIISIDDRKWMSGVDYLFFRNHMPNKSKLMLEAKFVRCGRAYACQCAWISVQGILKISEDPALKSKWVCGKHDH